MKKVLLIVTVFLMSYIFNNNLYSLENWQQLDGPFGGIVISLASSGSNFFAGTQTGGLYKSTDYGAHWNPIGKDLPFTDIQAIHIHKDRLFVVNREHGLFKSDDWGVTWDTAHKGITNFNIRGLANTDGKLFMAIKNVGIYYSTDNGDSWTLRNFGLQSLAVNYIHTSGGAVYVATDKGIHLTPNLGESWSVFKETGMYNFVMRNGGTIFIASFGSIQATSNNGQDWINVSNNNLGTGTIYCMETLDNYIMVGRSTGYYAATFSGADITNIHSTLTSTRVYALWKDFTFFYAGTSKGVFFSQTYGSKWQNSYTGINNERVTALCVTDTSYYVGLYDNGLEFSSDKGKSWENMNLGNVNVKKILKTGNNIYILVGNSLRFTNTNGSTWEERELGFQDVTDINCIYEHKGKIYAGTNLGIFYSSNNGLKWFELSDELDTKSIVEMYIDKNDIFYIATPDKMYLSRDQGITWQTSIEGMLSYNITCVQGFDDYLIAGSYPQPSFAGDFYISSDQGRNWKASGLNLLDQYISDIESEGGMLFLTLRGINGVDSRGVYFSSNMGKSWHEYNDEIRNIDVMTLTAKNNEIIAGTFGAGIYRNVIPEQIETPKLIYPSDKQNNVVKNPLLDFSDVIQASSYVVMLSSTSDFKPKMIIVNDTVSTSNYQVHLDSLDYETTYYWKVCQIQGDRVSDFSDVFEFTTEKQLVTKTVLTSPANNSPDLWVETELIWEPLEGADEYNIQISDVNDFSNIVYEVSVSTSNYTVPKGKLDFEKEYFWRVSAKIYDITREWSDSFSFKTMKLNLSQATLKAVKDNSDGVNLSITLSWDAVQYADSYQLQVSKDEQFSSTVFDENIQEIENTLTKTNLEFSTDYFWRVKAKYLTNEGVWSENSTFKTVQEVSVNEKNDDQIELYPNPSKGELNIIFDENNICNYIILFDNLGNKILSKSVSNSDGQFVLLLPEYLQSGIYFLKINNETKKVVLIR